MQPYRSKHSPETGHLATDAGLQLTPWTAAPHYFDLAMADLVDGKQVSAKQNLKMALDNDPSNYPDPIKSLNGFKNTVQFKMWSHCAERLQKNPFAAALGDLISDFQREPPQ